ncbi:TIGR03086 family metal-binding protein [Amycolatopsis rhabdoformis]|uniref:TIGR03086 family metal-binding protein n=1 Tax=Amycolatopsis rhabdoformis TaxID=1448059 RepID=A0ABZ1HYX3_9PSEU|nr:TIGR03086 family metal-binding protein [Amycolatopsis rhabdoformis]WSE26826.1 TIGR03086 family metal-binding protein [Amycolatopsis rhabdoformis]
MISRFLRAGAEFERRLRLVTADRWSGPTPCDEWTVRQLVNHVTRGNLNYIALLHGASAAEFLALRDADALGADPLAAFGASLAETAAAFSAPGALDLLLDYPLGPVRGAQALAVRTTDTVVHTWDLARALGTDETLDAGLVSWTLSNLDTIYAGLAETPVSAETTHRFFAEPLGEVGSSSQELLLYRMGRRGVVHREA